MKKDKTQTYVKENFKYLLEENKDGLFMALGTVFALILVIGLIYWIIYIDVGAFYDNWFLAFCGGVFVVFTTIMFTWLIIDKIICVVRFIKNFIYTDMRPKDE